MNLLLLLLATQIQGPFQVIKQGGSIYLVPQGIIKAGPRSHSMADPSNPYREPQSSVIAPPTQTQKRVLPYMRPMGKTVVLINPYCELRATPKQ